MPKILVAVSIDAVGAGGIPAVLAAAGLDVTVIGRQGLAVASSRFVSACVRTGNSPREVREGLEAHVAENPGVYRRVVIADEPLLRTFLTTGPGPALAAICPVVADTLRLGRILSKIAFSEDAVAAGMPVPAFRVLTGPEAAAPNLWQGKPFEAIDDKNARSRHGGRTRPGGTRCSCSASSAAS